MSDQESNGDERDPFKSEMEEFLNNLISGLGTGGALPFGDPAAMQKMFGMMQSSFSGNQTAKGLNLDIAHDTAKSLASKKLDKDKAEIVLEAFHTASLWVSEVTSIGTLTENPRAISQAEWVNASMEMWSLLSSPIIEKISELLKNSMTTNLPEELSQILPNAEVMINRIGNTLFAAQLGQVIGKLSKEVLAGGDVGVPILSGVKYDSGVLIPENMINFATGLEQTASEVAMFLAVREAAHAALFKHAKWIKQYLLTLVSEYANAIEIDLDHFQDLAMEIDIANPDALTELVKNGALIPPRNKKQEAILERVATLMALIEGWVDVVTTAAARRLPGSIALAEMMRRRRATAGPSQRAFASLIGLDLQPRLQREAAAMWEEIEKEFGAESRDSLWDHPDLLPSADEVKDAQKLLSRLRESTGFAGVGDEMDRELKKLLGQEPDDIADPPFI